MRIAVDVMNWHKPLLCRNSEDLKRRRNDYDHVVLGEPLNRKTLLEVCNENVNTKLNAKGKHVKKEKLVFGFVVATVKMLSFFKRNSCRITCATHSNRRNVSIK